MIKNIFFDFNGTILDDVDLCLELLNNILRKQNKKLVDLNTYKDIFRFPVKDYYTLAGVDFNLESFDSLSKEFIKDYQPRSFNCKLSNGLIDVIETLLKDNYNLYILSASQIDNLLEQCNILGITKYFKGIIGIDNIKAASKIEVGKEYILKNNINPSESIMIGDTNHDYEVATSLGFKPVLYLGGHQSLNQLKDIDCIKINDMQELLDILKETNND